MHAIHFLEVFFQLFQSASGLHSLLRDMKIYQQTLESVSCVIHHSKSQVRQVACFLSVLHQCWTVMQFSCKLVFQVCTALSHDVIFISCGHEWRPMNAQNRSHLNRAIVTSEDPHVISFQSHQQDFMFYNYTQTTHCGLWRLILMLFTFCF